MTMLKINSPFRKKDEVIPLIKAGANELYCGYVSPEWIEKFTELEFERKGLGSNFTDLEELKEAVKLAHQHKVPVSIAVNGLYVSSQYPLLLKTFRQLEKIGIDAVIVADLGLLLTLRKQGFRGKIHVSTGGTVFNSEAVKFYEEFGVSRIILDRQVPLEDIRKISRENPAVDFEVFILNTLCVYIDGFCTFLHARGEKEHLSEESEVNESGQERNLKIISVYDSKSEIDACALNYSIKAFDKNSQAINNKKIFPAFFKHSVTHKECAACALYYIERTKVKSVKIVGRQLSADSRLKDTLFIRSILDILKNNRNIGLQDFIMKTQKLYHANFNKNSSAPCTGADCYHPQVLLDAKFRDR